MAVSEVEKDPKAAYCPFDNVFFHSLNDLREVVKERRLRPTVLDINPHPYGTCCKGSNDAVSWSSSTVSVLPAR